MDLEKSNDMNDIKNCLKDAGLFEENMDPKVMLEYYSAIKNSENTASEEDELRKSNIQSSDCKNSDTQCQKIETMKFEESESEEPDQTHSTEEFLNFCDMPTLSEKMLEVIHHEPKYHLAVNFYSGSYKKLNLKQKVSLLYKYHTDLNKKIATFAKKSIYPTPRPKDILASNKFCGSLLKNSFDMNDDLERSDGSLYISRSGRQMKRKKYTEDFDFDDEFQDNFFENKKMKDTDDNEWRLKKTRGADKKNAILINNNNNNNDEKSKSTPRKQNQQNIETSTLTPNETKRDYSTPLSKRNSLRKLSNDEIIKRSSLFSPVTVKKTRSEAMFDKLREEEHKKSLKEKEVQLFKDSLKDIESEEIMKNESKMQVTESPIVSMKSPVGRRAINTRKRTTQEEPEKSGLESGKKISKNTSKTGEGTSLARNLTFTKEEHPNSSLNEQNAGQSADMKKIECPLCGEAFPEEDIQRLPFKHTEVMRKWIQSIRRENWMPLKYSKLCSQRFLIEDYEIH